MNFREKRILGGNFGCVTQTTPPWKTFSFLGASQKKMEAWKRTKKSRGPPSEPCYMIKSTLKIARLLSLGDSGFLPFFRVVLSDEMANPESMCGGISPIPGKRFQLAIAS